jgi:PKHD-type hydroxylase
MTVRVIPDRLILVYVLGSAFALAFTFAAFATFVFAALVLALATLAGMLLGGAGAARVADDMPRLGRADDLTPLTFAFTLAALVLAAFADLVDRRGQRLGRSFGQHRLTRLRDHEGTDAHPQFRTHGISLLAKALVARDRTDRACIQRHADATRLPMLIMIANVLDADNLQSLRDNLGKTRYVDGRRTAGREARPVKRNEQVDRSDPLLAEMQDLVIDRLLANPLFRMATRPHVVRPPLFSRYEPGMAYGSHVDDAIMGGMRTDVSVTIFLSEPDTYEGGELVIESAAGEQDVKLAAGDAVVYPTTALHRVAPVVSGERLAAVTWVRSLIRDADARELLFDLETARHALFERLGKTPELDLLAKTQSNLLRRWAED